MKQTNRLTWSCTPILAGGFIWMVGGMVLSGRPGGHPPQSFRATMDVMPLLGTGLFLIAGRLGLQALGLRRRGGRLFSIAAACLLIGAVLYPAGAAVRRVFLKGGWEPMMPAGFLLVIAGCLLYAIASGVKGLFPGTSVVLLIGVALSLFGFNDQYTPWMGTVFGVFVTAFGCARGLTCTGT